MSRSYRKTPIFKDDLRSSKKWVKRQANKKVRQYKGELPDGSWHKNLYDRWSICDWKYSGFEGPHKYALTLSGVWEGKPHWKAGVTPDYDYFYKDWYRWYFRK